MTFIAYVLCILQDGLNVLHLAVIGNHVDVVRALVGEVGLSVTHRDNVSTKGVCCEAAGTAMQYSTELDNLAWVFASCNCKLRYEVKEEVAYSCRQVNCETEANREV